MKPLYLLPIVFLLLVGFTLASPSTDRTDYYNDGTFFITDGLLGDGDGDVPIDGGTVSNTDVVTVGGWDSGTATYSSTQAYSGSLSISVASGQSAIYSIPVNASYTGIISASIYCTETNCGLLFQNDYDGAGGSTRHGFDNGGGTLRCKVDGANNDCGALTLNAWFNVSINYTDPDNIRFSVNNTVVHTEATSLNHAIGDIELLFGDTTTFYFDNLYLTYNEVPQEPPSAVTFVPPTPADAAHNNTQVTINMTSTNNETVLWFGNTSELTQDNVVVNMTMSEGYANYTTSVSTEGTYYYKASLDNGATNTSTRTWVFDTTDPDITLNPNNAFNNSNVTTFPYNSTQIINISIEDNIDLFGFLINITQAGVTYFNYSNETLSGTTFDFFQELNVSQWPDGNYSVDIVASDSHTAFTIPPYLVQAKGSELHYGTEAGNSIRIISEEEALTSSTKHKDRYDFHFDFVDKGTRPRIFHLYSDHPISYRKNSGYKAHFVIWNGRQGNWVDFEGAPGQPTITRVSDYHYIIHFQDIPEKITFRSIGGLNVNEKNYLFQKNSISVSSATILPAVAFTEDTLEGYCIPADGLATYTNLSWRWYQNGSLHSSGSSNDIENGTNVNVNNISSSSTSTGDSWIVSCQASNGGIGSVWLNSSARTISSYGIDSCTAYSTQAMQFNFRNLDGTAKNVNTSSTITYTRIGAGGDIFNFSFVNSSISQFPYCIDPASVEFYGDIQLQYEDGDAVYQFATNGTIMNSTLKNITLYIDGQSQVIATVFDNTNNVIEGAYIQVQRYDFATGNYLTTGVYLTNFEGEVNLYLTLNTALYRFLIYFPYNNLRQTTEPTYITSSNIEFRLNLYEEIAETFFDLYGVDGELTFSNLTNTFTFIYNDPSLSTQSAALRVYKINWRGETLENSTSNSGTSGTLQVGISAQNDTTYLARAYITQAGIERLYDSLSHNFYGENKTGLLGILGVILFTIMFAFAFPFSLSIGIIAIPIPTMIFAIMGWINLDPGIAVMLESVAIIIAIFINDRG